MAQAGFTPLLVYGSTTATNVPLSANLTTSANGVELAVNAKDGKLFYKDDVGSVQVIATKAATAGAFTSVAITGGTINGTTIGATTPSTVAGTTVSASSQFTGAGTGLTGSAAGLSIGGNAATATSATTATTASTANALNTSNSYTITGLTVTGTTVVQTPTLSTQAATKGYVDSNFVTSTSPALTGTPTAPTAAPGTSTTQIATTAFASALAFSSALPSQSGNAGKFVTTDGTNPSWASVYPAQAGNAGKFVTTDGTNPSWASVYPTQTGNAGKVLSTDGTNTAWLANGTPILVTNATTSFAAVAGTHYSLTNGSAVTLTLPASPASGDTVWATFKNGLATNVIARNGKTIMGLAEDLTVDSVSGLTVELRYADSDWRLV